MSINPFKRFGVLAMAGLICCGSTHAVDAPAYSWKKTEHTTCLMNGEKVVWQHNHDPAEGKSYIHPLSTSHGEVLTWLRPKDHVWHRAMWFSWKYIQKEGEKKLNYWEERRGKSEGETEIKEIKVDTNDDFSAVFHTTLSYHPPGKEELLAEKRTLTISAPDKDGNFTLDWTSTFTATGGNIILERTPIKGQPGGKGWGGYAGLSIRMAKETRGWQFVNSEGGEGKGQTHGKPAQWVAASGKTPSGKQAFIAFISHTSNPREPSIWYVEPGMPYFSPAIIFKEPMKLEQDKTLALKYRIVVCNGEFKKDAVDALAKSFNQ